MSKFCLLRTGNKRFYLGMKTSDFVLHGQKLKLAIEVGIENIFYPIIFISMGTTRDGHDLVLEDNRTELNQTVFKIHNNQTKLNCLSFEPNQTIKVVRF
jgi:hypothetical protein